MNQGQLTETDYMNLLAEWDTVKKQKDALVAKERSLRAQLTGHFFPNTMDKATQYQPIGNGYRLKCEGGIDYTIDKTELALFNETEADAAELIASCIRYKPELDKRNYDKMSDEDKAKVNAFIVTKPKSVTLSIVEPKESK